MEALIDSIRIALSDGASDTERSRGLVACRAVADALEGVVVPASRSAPPPLAESVVAEIVSPAELAMLAQAIVSPISNNLFAGLGADQILELAISKLRSAVGDDGAAPAPPPVGQPFRLTLVPVPRFQ